MWLKLVVLVGGIALGITTCHLAGKTSWEDCIQRYMSVMQ